MQEQATGRLSNPENVAGEQRNGIGMHAPAPFKKQESEEEPLTAAQAPSKTFVQQHMDVIQRNIGFEYEMGSIKTQTYWSLWRDWYPHNKGDVLANMQGFNITADEAVGVNDPEEKSQLELIIHDFDENDVGERNNFLNVTLPLIQTTLNNLINDAHTNGGNAVNGWVNGQHIRGIGVNNIRMKSPSAAATGIAGQVQMTGGFTLPDMAHYLSGGKASGLTRRITAEQQLAPPGPNDLSANSVNGLLVNYTTGESGAAWQKAMDVVNNTFDDFLSEGNRRQLAVIVLLMARIPCNARMARADYPKGDAGDIMARTDFSKLMMLLPDQVKAEVTKDNMVHLVINTINSLLEDEDNVDEVSEDDTVFVADSFNNNSVRMDMKPSSLPVDMYDDTPTVPTLTIGSWVRKAMPSANWIFAGYTQGKDQMTKAHFPGTDEQKAQVESMGGFGNRLDNDTKPIFELRRLGTTYADQLTQVLRALLRFKRE